MKRRTREIIGHELVNQSCCLGARISCIECVLKSMRGEKRKEIQIDLDELKKYTKVVCDDGYELMGKNEN